MHEPPHQRQPRQGRKQRPQTSQRTSGSTSAERISSSDSRQRIEPQSTSRPASSAGNRVLDQRERPAIRTRDAGAGLKQAPGQFDAPRMLRPETIDRRRSGPTSTDHRSSHQTRQDFTRFAEVFDHFQAGNDRFSDLRHDDVPQVNPKAG